MALASDGRFAGWNPGLAYEKFVKQRVQSRRAAVLHSFSGFSALTLLHNISDILELLRGNLMNGETKRQNGRWKDIEYVFG
jgi:hypothetical protein